MGNNSNKSNLTEFFKQKELIYKLWWYETIDGEKKSFLDSDEVEAIL